MGEKSTVKRNFAKTSSSINKRMIGVFLSAAIAMTGCANNKATEQKLSLYRENQLETVDETCDEDVKISDNEKDLDNEKENDNHNEPDNIVKKEEIDDKHQYNFTMCFAGDINLDDNTTTTTYLNSVGGDIEKCISPELIKIMNDADIMCLNNEFPFTTKGEPTPGKMVHFRANPEKVKYIKQLGVDVVSLANNHVYDYGEISLTDTISTLDNAGIKRVGAGRNLDEAMKPYYTEIDNRKIAIVAATRAEKNIKTPCATNDSSGVLYCYDTKLFVKEIKEAKENADFVIAFVHWGTEYSDVLEEAQLTSAKEYIDAGADVIVGAHSHCLQGMEFYKGKPIIYSMGNYWFNNKTLDTMLVQLHFSGDDINSKLEVRLIPAIQSECRTIISKAEDEKKRILSYLERVSINVQIDKDGYVTEK